MLNFVCRVINRFSNLYWRIMYRQYRNVYKIPVSFRFNGKDIVFYGDGKITCGENSYIGDRSSVHAANKYEVFIGDGCHIASNVRVFTETADADQDFSRKPIPSKYGNVYIGSYCWIGANVVINPGVSIGENAVVGANSIVTKNIPDGEIWGGVPARFIRKKSKLPH